MGFWTIIAIIFGSGLIIFVVILFRKPYFIDILTFVVARFFNLGQLEYRYHVPNFQEGYSYLDCSRSMTQGRSERVKFSIFTTPFLLNFYSQNKDIVKIELSDVMGAKLLSKDFEITTLNTDQQAILNDRETEWQWDVTPMKHGLRSLQLIVVAKIIALNSAETYDFPISTTQITVEINRTFIVKRFWNKNWQWIVSLIFGSGIVWTLLKLLKVIPS